MKRALHALRVLMGGWAAVAAALGYRYKAVTGASELRGKVTGTMAVRIARAARMPLEDLMGGACPMCRGTGRQP